jgi:NAD(P)-dependent dehydrogenase (short-subunit alcohol dehydrogenase family)
MFGKPIGDEAMSLETVSPTPRVVLITGAATGIGKACADRLASSGWRVFGGARGVSRPDSRVEMIVMDVNDEASVQDALTLVLAKAGRLDAVINNAGFSMGGAVEDVTIEEAKAIFETNFSGSYAYAGRRCQLCARMVAMSST